MKRKSLLPSKQVVTYSKPQLFQCVCCGAEVRPGFVYTGSVISGISFRTIKSHSYTDILGVIECPPDVDRPQFRTKVIGGDLIETTRNVSFFKREKGWLCDKCAGSNRYVKDRAGNLHPLVKVDPRPGFIDQTAIPKYEGPKDWSSVDD